MNRTVLCLAALAYASPLAAQRADVNGLRVLLSAGVRVEVTDKRFSAVMIDSVADTVRDAQFANRDRRLFSYLVEHQLRPEDLFRGVAQAERPAEVLIDNLLRDSAAVRRLDEYLRAGTAARTGPMRQARVALITEIGARFYYPMIQPKGEIVFYRCAGIALNARFRTAAAAFRAQVANATADTALVARARAQFYAALRDSRELHEVLRSAYLQNATRHPFVVPEWGDSRSR